MAEWQRVLMVHDGLLPLEDLRVGDTFILTEDREYQLEETLSPAAALRSVREHAPDTVLEVGRQVRARDVHMKTIENNSVCRAVWTNGLAVVVGIDLARQTATAVVRRGREFTRRKKQFPFYQIKPEAAELRAR